MGKEVKGYRITVEQAAKMMQVCPQFIRVGLQQGRLPFGTAVKLSRDRWTYYISPKKLKEYIGEV